eukprot:evm.model.scf_1526.5 EVM.evm.TU.scf_1526.5   scf_1526:31768-36205(+)
MKGSAQVAWVAIFVAMLCGAPQVREAGAIRILDDALAVGSAGLQWFGRHLTACANALAIAVAIGQDNAASASVAIAQATAAGDTEAVAMAVAQAQVDGSGLSAAEAIAQATTTAGADPDAVAQAIAQAIATATGQDPNMVKGEIQDDIKKGNTTAIAEALSEVITPVNAVITLLPVFSTNLPHMLCFGKETTSLPIL